VFDPLAISLVIAANFAFNQLKKKSEVIVVPEPEKIIERVEENQTPQFIANLEDITNSNADFLNKQIQLNNELARLKKYINKDDENIKNYF
jgi:hypothetical protein